MWKPLPRRDWTLARGPRGCDRYRRRTRPEFRLGPKRCPIHVDEGPASFAIRAPAPNGFRRGLRAPFFFGSAVAASIRAGRSLGRERAFLAIGLRSGCWREPAPPPLPARSTRIWRYRTDRPGLAPAAEGRGTFVQEDVIDYPLARRTPFSEIVRRQARPLPASCFAASASRRTRSSLSAWTWYPVTPIGLIGTI